MEKQDAYSRARERAEAKIGFYTHLAVYLVVGVLLVAIDLFTSPGYTWAHWPIMGWGIGVLFHGLSVFVFRGGSGITDRMIEKEMGRGA